MGNYRTRINQASLTIKAIAYSNAAVARAANATIARAKENVISDDLINTGTLLNSFRKKDITTDPMKQTYKVGSTDPNAKFPEKGTKGTPYVPGRILRFKPKGSASFVFARSTGPIRAYGFMNKARLALTKRDFLPK